MEFVFLQAYILTGMRFCRVKVFFSHLAVTISPVMSHYNTPLFCTAFKLMVIFPTRHTVLVIIYSQQQSPTQKQGRGSV